jgi:large subunit ribosomal protein L3
MKFLLAKKVNMTQVFGEDGRVTAVTILDVAPTFISQVKTQEKDGYTAVQIATGSRREKNVSKAVKGHTKGLNAGEGKSFATLPEFRIDDISTFNKGDAVALENFAIGDKVEVSSVSKGKGFQGVVKRHGFHGGPRSHGQKHSEREPGSISGSGGRAGGRVAKGMRMAGRMGSDRVTVKNLKVVGVDAVNHVLLISGAIPGRRGTLVEVKSR